MNNQLVLSGAGLIGLGFLPTPDDVTVISPVLQIAIGTGLVALGLFMKGDKK